MRFIFDKPTCQNIRKSLRKEWIETNGLGDYASSSMINCNTRRYHGLFVTGMGSAEDRSVLLSTLEESLLVGAKELFFSSHKYPERYYPHGHEYLHGMEAGVIPLFKYRFGDLALNKEIMMIPGKRLLLIRYEIQSPAGDIPPVTLKIKPMIAFRHFHALTRANSQLDTGITSIKSGFSIKPYEGMPSLYMQLEEECGITPEQCWYYNVKYLIEQERGFPCEEDLFQPAVFEIAIHLNQAVYLAVSTEEFSSISDKSGMEKLWIVEAKRRHKNLKKAETIHGHLAMEGGRFIIRQPESGAGVLAGYHWFNIWGRDMLISLPGLTFCAGRGEVGVEILSSLGSYVKNGLIPNCFSSDGSHAYNSVDASLWYVWAVQQMLLYMPETKDLVKKECWPVIKEIISAYSSGTVPYVTYDHEGFLHVGTKDTQLTWMDASVNGRPVTPRNGCPVEINALWYNALAFANSLAEQYKKPALEKTALLKAMRDEFVKRFWIKRPTGGYLADVWRENDVDITLRPNQIFAVSLPYPILYEIYHADLMAQVKHHLLTPYGLRTLRPGTRDYRPVYSGGPEERDSAYHQGAVWPWLLGAYTDALLHTTHETNIAVKDLLTMLRPLFAQHLGDAGMGSISEIFDADPPHLPNGTIAQAWSVAECFRLLKLLEKAAPAVYAEWEADTRKGGQ